MKTTLICASFHHKNTWKIGRVLADRLEGRLLSVTDASPEDVAESDLVGFGSGIYYALFHKKMRSFIDSLPNQSGRKAFLFSTAGLRKNIFLNRGSRCASKILKKKGFRVIGRFDCLGYDTNGILKTFGGLNKGKPGPEESEKAILFAEKIRQILQETD